jgi:hypothetical protein
MTRNFDGILADMTRLAPRLPLSYPMRGGVVATLRIVTLGDAARVIAALRPEFFRALGAN